MAKMCLLCNKKLNMMNSVTIGGADLCLDCRDRINMIENSDNVQFLNKKADELQRSYAPGSAAYNFAETIRNQITNQITTIEEAERKEKERLENEEKRRQEQIRLEKERLEREEKRRQEQIRLKEESIERNRKLHEDRLNSLRYRGYEGYYEYKTVIVNDDSVGGVSSYEITSTLNDLALDGWRLVSSYANELGHNSKPGTTFTAGTNATIDEHVFILERYIKL